MATTEVNMHATAIHSAMKEATTDNSPLACQDCSVLEGSKTHADSNNPQLHVVLRATNYVEAAFDYDSYSVKWNHCPFPVVHEGRSLGSAEMGSPVTCLKRKMLVPLIYN
jgi:hypothetical protein